MWSGQFLFGGISVLFSALLRAMAKFHFRHPIYARPRAFQNGRFISLLSVLSNALFVLGFLSLFLLRFWIGLTALLLYPSLLLPGLVFLLGKIYPL